MEEFESSFRYFDTDAQNSLDTIQLQACLASLGRYYSTTNLQDMFGDRVGFREFITFVEANTQEQATPEQLQMAFQEIAGDKEHVTSQDLRLSGVQEPVVSYLTAIMPLVDGDESRLDYNAYLEMLFSPA